MSSKKTVRKQQAEHQKERQGRQRRSTLTLAALVLVAALVVLAVALFVGPRRGDRADDLIWSPAHGHWHRR